MSSNSNHDMYYENSSQRSPGSHRHPAQTLHRQPSRQFDAYGGMPQGLYTAEDHAAQHSYAPRYPQDRMNAATMNSNVQGFDPWNSYGAPQQSNTIGGFGGATSRMKTLPNRGRPGLPTSWMDQPPLPPMPQYHALGNAGLGQDHLRGGHSELDEELIPTAIVIKNIPFAVKKEQLVGLMTEMGLPLPYAFNYHFDNGIFRGLAFANFTTAEETAVVIEAMNHYELCGRKLRVEYKKMLPLMERERIEREKRERRGQLQEQHQPLPSSGLHSQPSMSSLSSQIMPASSPSPLSARNQKPGKNFASPLARPYSDEPEAYDLNDPAVLQFYTQLAVFKEDPTRDNLTLPPTLLPAQRRIVHTLAHQMGLAHVSKGTGDQRAVHIFRVHDGPNISPPLPQMPTSHPGDNHRRALNRAATTDFSDVRGNDFYGTLGRQSSGFLGFPDSPGGLNAAHNLRAAKSYADLRSYTPSPVPSTASFPATLSTNFARFAEYGHNGSAASNPNLSATANRDESLLVNGMNNMNIGNNYGQSGSPRSLRSAWDRDTPGPIGGHRSFSTAAYDDQSRERGQGLPSRQPRGPLPERGGGFSSRQSRQNGGHSGRGSDEISSQTNLEITVE